MGKSCIFTILLFIIFTVNIPTNAQLLNGSFENWDVLSDPVNWVTGDIPGVIDVVTQSNDAQDGISSARLEVIDLFGLPHSGSLHSIDAISGLGHTITERYTNLSGYYKFSPNGSARLTYIVTIFDASSIPIGAGILDVYGATNIWTQFNVPIDYISSAEAARITVLISIIDTAASGFDPTIIGSNALIDNLTLGNPTNIEENNDLPIYISLSQNYPNPFNPSTTIRYSIPIETGNEIGDVRLIIFDVLGSKIKTLVSEKQKPGYYEVNFDGSELTSGIYFYRLSTSDYVETKKMLLIK